MTKVIRIVEVEERSAEIARAELTGSTITYSGVAEVARGVIERRAENANVTTVEAFALVAETGWSNGYLMVALD